MFSLFFISRFPKDVSEAYALGVKEDDYVFLTAGGKWSRDYSKAVCFLNDKAGATFLRHMRWTDRERCEVLEVSGDFA